jgi:serine/threonine-protein kinase
MEPEAPAPDRRTLYRFQVDRLLGRGGAGSVYRAYDPDLEQIVALKLFYENYFRSRLHVRDLARSAKRFRRFEHANLVQVFEFIDGDEGRCLSMEYVDGPNLRWFMEHRPWSLQERLVTSIQICNGLQYLHDQNVIHHDLKPSNVMFTQRGQVKLCDFSLSGSRLLGLIERSQHDLVTPLYVAPELLRKQKATAHSDIYALGVTFYQLFSNKTPFSADNLQALYQCHMRVTPEHPTIVNGKVPKTLGDIIMRMLAKDPERRYDDVTQLRIALAEVSRSRI